ncbi:hypothetical protein ABW21_db0206214 [Orbilia brochopaga]|nr:hypothetical protein ABW21_db0206214 [Drechslerella brochopaga]
MQIYPLSLHLWSVVLWASLDFANGAAVEIFKREPETGTVTLPSTAVATGPLQIDTSVPASPTGQPPAPVPEPPGVYDQYKGQNKQVLLNNIDWNAAGDEERKKLKKAMRNALNFWWTGAVINGLGDDVTFIGDPGNPEDFARFQDVANNAELYCFSVPRSADAEAASLQDPQIYCENKYSIRLGNTRNEVMRIRCLDAVKIAVQLADYITEPNQAFSGPSPNVPENKKWPWEAVGTSFWSDDPSWFIYIGKENGDDECKNGPWGRYLGANEPDLTAIPTN